MLFKSHLSKTMEEESPPVIFESSQNTNTEMHLLLRASWVWDISSSLVYLGKHQIPDASLPKNTDYPPCYPAQGKGFCLNFSTKYPFCLFRLECYPKLGAFVRTWEYGR